MNRRKKINKNCLSVAQNYYQSSYDKYRHVEWTNVIQGNIFK